MNDYPTTDVLTWPIYSFALCQNTKGHTGNKPDLSQNLDDQMLWVCMLAIWPMCLSFACKITSELPPFWHSQTPPLVPLYMNKDSISLHSLYSSYLSAWATRTSPFSPPHTPTPAIARKPSTRINRTYLCTYCVHLQLGQWEFPPFWHSHTPPLVPLYMNKDSISLHSLYSSYLSAWGQFHEKT